MTRRTRLRCRTRPAPAPGPALLLALLTPLASGACAQDVAGSADSAQISRYQGSTLVAQTITDFQAHALLNGYALSPANRPTSLLNLEGRLERRVYQAPAGRGALEVQRNYAAALTGAGATLLTACSGRQACQKAVGRWHEAATEWASSYHGQARDRRAYELLNYGEDDTRQYALYQWAQAGSLRYVALLSVQGSKGTATLIDLLQPKAMDSGKVQATTADALASGLRAEGRVAVYGVFFDTGRAEIRPESRPQIEQMARLLQADAALRVAIVGHTDNQGSLETNQALSQRRAEAIMAELVRDHGIAASRLLARGVAHLAPVASNRDEAGRGRNRRVELVEL